ncbi:hypothetical protein CBNA_1987 [Coxiella burnetii str. Namibia]|uniref:Uncharacterized protein n=1 Tax=Coxiella burnetii (strain Dugway 5J108-111) TaxID=434922 RepID=B5XHK9_COXBN|nr:hypothetical protein CBUD_2046a [Coxiella burnetii Dugway 5J108-111]AIT64177.1 hypothetical protein CBNA_1987 [Coxiella burnetii str. Namibia]
MVFIEGRDKLEKPTLSEVLGRKAACGANYRKFKAFL